MTSTTTTTATVSTKSNFELMLINLSEIKKIFPLAFPSKSSGIEISPLKLNVIHELTAGLKANGLDISVTQVRKVLKFWCSRNFYIKALHAATHRIDLAGKPFQLVTDIDRNDAKNRLMIHQNSGKSAIIKNAVELTGGKLNKMKAEDPPEFIYTL